MIDDYNKVTEYINEDIKKIYDELNVLNDKIGKLQEFLDNMTKYNSDYQYSLELFELIDGNGDRYEKLCDTLFILDRVDYEKLGKEPQFKEMESFLKEIEEKIYGVINELIKKYSELKEDYLARKNKCEQVIEFINDTSIDINNQGVLESLDKFQISNELKDLIINYLKNRMEVKEKTDEVHIISKLDSEVVDKIKDYIRKFYQLSITEKKSMISASELEKQGDYDNLIYVAYGFTQAEIIYYVTIYDLLNSFNDYIDIVNGKSDGKSSLTDVMDKINGYLRKLANVEKLMHEKEIEEDVADESHNIVLFLDVNEGRTSNVNKTSIVDIDIQNIRNKNDGEESRDIRDIVRMLKNRFINMDNILFRKLGYNANKVIVNHTSSLFKEFNVWCSKGEVNNPVRIPYTILGVSENNKKEIIARYNLPSDANIYLVYGLFTKKNDDSEYVRITNSRLQKEYDTINFIMKIFKNDFDELSRIRAFKLIDNSLLKMEELSSINKEKNVK